MGCYKPLPAWQKITGGRLTFTPTLKSQFLHIPCGYCIGCRLEKSRQWAVRCVHEAQLNTENCFITLTFNEEAMKRRKTKSLDKRDFQLFMKKLRKHYSGRTIRYFQCGEYGENLKRPHYHACLFGLDFKDKYLWRGKLFRSPTLEKLWPHGFSTIGEVNFETAAYVARYVLKKRYGEDANKHYSRTNETTGEITELKPEYTTMSRRPGIGKNWITKYHKDVYPGDRVVMRGHEAKPPRYYDKHLENENASLSAIVKERRKIKIEKKLLEETGPSLETQEKHAVATLKEKPRRLER